MTKNYIIKNDDWGQLRRVIQQIVTIDLADAKSSIADQEADRNAAMAIINAVTRGSNKKRFLLHYAPSGTTWPNNPYQYAAMAWRTFNYDSYPNNTTYVGIVPDDIKPGTTVDLKFYWKLYDVDSPAKTGDVEWTGYVNYISPYGGYLATEIEVDAVITTVSSGRTIDEVDLATFTSDLGVTPGDIIQMKLIRDATSANDTFQDHILASVVAIGEYTANKIIL
jgi:hypothetical protein